MKEYLDLLKQTKNHVVTGISYMIPFLVAGAVPLALGVLFGGTNVVGTFPKALYEIGEVGMSLFIAALAGYIAYAIADRPGLAPGFIGGMLAVNVGAGFIGGIVAGLLAGYSAYSLKKIKLKGGFQPIMAVLVVPCVSVLIVGFVMKFVIGVPLASLTNLLTVWLSNMNGKNVIILGIILGAMIGFDFGGPINKIAYTFAVGFISSKVYGPMASVGAAIGVCSVGMGLATWFAPKLYSDEEKAAGKVAIVLGCITISEGAIPFASKDPIRVMVACSIGSALAGGIAAAAGVMNTVPLGGIIILPLLNNPVMYVVAMGAGSLVTALLVNFLKGHVGKKAKCSE